MSDKPIEVMGQDGLTYSAREFDGRLIVARMSPRMTLWEGTLGTPIPTSERVPQDVARRLNELLGVS